MQYFTQRNGALIFRRRQELLEIRPWGEGLRIRATENQQFTGHDWALSVPSAVQGKIEIYEDHAIVVNGKIKARITNFGKISFCNQQGKERFIFPWEQNGKIGRPGRNTREDSG